MWLYMPPWYFIEEEAEGASHDWLALQQGLLGLRRNFGERLVIINALNSDADISRLLGGGGAGGSPGSCFGHS